MYKAPGIFEQSHYLCEMQNAMINLYEEPDDMKDLLKYIAEYEIRLAEQVCKYLKPDALFHHDDWGSQNSTFMSRDMFEEFLMPLYKDVYGCYKENGVQLIVHHSDSYAETLVPCMIEMKIDIWQGVMTTNNIPELIRKYGGQISFMAASTALPLISKAGPRKLSKRKSGAPATNTAGSTSFQAPPRAAQSAPIPAYTKLPRKLLTSTAKSYLGQNNPDLRCLFIYIFPHTGSCCESGTIRWRQQLPSYCFYDKLLYYIRKRRR